jgi:hypothetical protein
VDLGPLLQYASTRTTTNYSIEHVQVDVWMGTKDDRDE